MRAILRLWSYYTMYPGKLGFGILSVVLAGAFGMLSGLMALWGALGTLHFADSTVAAADGRPAVRPGLFSLVRPEAGGHALRVPDGMVRFAADREVARIAAGAGRDVAETEVAARVPEWREAGFGRWLLFIAGVGIFCGFSTQRAMASFTSSRVGQTSRR